MGSYTEINFQCSFDIRTVNRDFFLNLQYMVNKEEEHIIDSHPFFKTDRYNMLFHSAGSAYFQPKNICNLFPEQTNWYFNLQTNFKNYGNEIQLFLDWITPHVALGNDDFLGYYRYEEDSHPTLIYSHFIDSKNTFKTLDLNNFATNPMYVIGLQLDT